MPDENKWQHWEDLPDSVEKRMLDQMAHFFVNKDLTLLAQILFESGEPFSRMFSTLGMGLFGPFLEFFGADAYAAFFRKEGNARALIDRIDQLELKKQEELTQKNKEKENRKD